MTGLAAASPRAEYDARLTRWRAAIGEAERRHLVVSNFRLAAALLFAVAFWLGLRGTSDMTREGVLGHLLAWIAIPAALFAVLAALHARVLARGDHARRAVRLYERGLARLNGTWMGKGADGDGFCGDHPYARDLDLFGPASLFQLLNVAKTQAGEAALAAWLRDPAALVEVRARQEAVRELTPNLDLREDVAVLADESQIGQTGHLMEWAEASPLRFPDWLLTALSAGSVVTALLAGLAGAGMLSLLFPLGWLVLQGLLVAPWRHVLHRSMHGFTMAELDLGLLVGLLDRVEREPFTSPRLRLVQQTLLSDGGAAEAIRRLRGLVSMLESSSHNLLFAPFTFALFIPQQLALRIARWHSVHGSSVRRWLDAAGEMEAFAALATYAYEHPGDSFPILADTEPIFDASALAHPLIAESTAVANDVSIGGSHARVFIVSGSNMSGKSTLLRSVGINVVLALAGAPVRARRLTMSALAIGATIRVADSLQEGHSRFYAEILRIRDVVVGARSRPTLFLLDEILHGTNSHDRRIGATAIVKALVESGAIGLVTTHDLALTALTDTLGGRARNTHFEDRIEDGKMVFDYQMRDGVVERSNALELMRAVGLDV